MPFGHLSWIEVENQVAVGDRYHLVCKLNICANGDDDGLGKGKMKRQGGR